jgi:hypothetical protein
MRLLFWLRRCFVPYKGNTKNGNKYLAWAFVEAANFARRYCPEAKSFYERKKSKTNGVLATKALAHKLARACCYIWMPDGKGGVRPRTSAAPQIQPSLVPILRQRLNITAWFYEMLQILSFTMFDRMALNQLLSRTPPDTNQQDSNNVGTQGEKYVYLLTY